MAPVSSEVDSYVRVSLNDPTDEHDSIHLKIADCGQTVSVWFLPRKRRGALLKLEKLETALALIRESLEE